MLIPYADWKKNMVYAINITLLVNKNLLERHLCQILNNQIVRMLIEI